MDSTQVSVLKQTNEVGLCCFLQGKDGRPLESKVCLEILGNLSNEALEWEFADQEFRAFLITADFTKSHSTRAVPVGFFHTTRGRGAFPGSFGSQLFSWGLSPRTLASGLLRSRHSSKVCFKLAWEQKKNIRNTEYHQWLGLPLNLILRES